jgi:hypothetical protein
LEKNRLKALAGAQKFYKAIPASFYGPKKSPDLNDIIRIIA